MPQRFMHLITFLALAIIIFANAAVDVGPPQIALGPVKGGTCMNVPQICSLPCELSNIVSATTFRFVKRQDTTTTFTENVDGTEVSIPETFPSESPVTSDSSSSDDSARGSTHDSNHTGRIVGIVVPSVLLTIGGIAFRIWRMDQEKKEKESRAKMVAYQEKRKREREARTANVMDKTELEGQGLSRVELEGQGHATIPGSHEVQGDDATAKELEGSQQAPPAELAGSESRRQTNEPGPNSDGDAPVRSDPREWISRRIWRYAW